MLEFIGLSTTMERLVATIGILVVVNQYIITYQLGKIQNEIHQLRLDRLAGR